MSVAASPRKIVFFIRSKSPGGEVAAFGKSQDIGSQLLRKRGLNVAPGQDDGHLRGEAAHILERVAIPVVQ